MRKKQIINPKQAEKRSIPIQLPYRCKDCPSERVLEQEFVCTSWDDLEKFQAVITEEQCPTCEKIVRYGASFDLPFDDEKGIPIRNGRANE